MVVQKVTKSERCLWFFNCVFHQALAVTTTFIFWTIFYNYNLNSEFSWHVILSTLAYIPLMGEAIILFSNDNVWSKNMERTSKCWMHGIVLIVSAALVTAGISIEINLKNGPHFRSVHGWTGLVSWILILISQFLGLAAARTQIFSRLLRPVHVKFAHNIFGILGYVFGIVSLCYGMETRSFTRLTTSDARTATYCLMGLTVFWGILTALKSCFNQLKAIIF